MNPDDDLFGNRRCTWSIGFRRAHGRSALEVDRHLLDHQLDVGTPTLVAHDCTSLRPTRAAGISFGWTRTKVLPVFWLTPKAEVLSPNSGRCRTSLGAFLTDKVT
jgi:hypothetical protein